MKIFRKCIEFQFPQASGEFKMPPINFHDTQKHFRVTFRGASHFAHFFLQLATVTQGRVGSQKTLEAGNKPWQIM